MKKHKISDIKIFVLIWSAIFMLLAFYPLLNKGTINGWFVLIAFIFAIIAMIHPLLLLPFYKRWIQVGEFIGSIVAKIIMVIIFYALFTPVSFVLKILKIDLLDKKIDKEASTYWVKRKIQPSTLKNQF